MATSWLKWKNNNRFRENNRLDAGYFPLKAVFWRFGKVKI